MDEEEEELEEEGEEAFWQALKEFLEDHKEDIGDVIKAYASNMKASLRQKGWTTAGVFILLGGVIGVIAFLALLGIVSGETVAFLVGAIVGYLFSFMRRYILGVGT